MKRGQLLGILALIIGFAGPATADLYYTPYNFSTLAGSPGVSGNATDADSGTDARFNLPVGVARDSAGNLYVADTKNHTIRKVSADGKVSRLAGSPLGVPGFRNATGDEALFRSPMGVAVDGSGNVYVADAGNHLIRKITPGRVVSTFAGNSSPSVRDEYGHIIGDFANGASGEARFHSPLGVAVDNNGNVYVSDTNNHVIRKISAGQVTTWAGYQKDPGHVDGTGTAARFDFPRGLAVDASGNLFVADQRNDAIRKVTAAGVVTTVGGRASFPGARDGFGVGESADDKEEARFRYPAGLAVGDDGSLYVAEIDNCLIRKLVPITIHGKPNYFVFTLAGWPRQAGIGNSTASGKEALFNSPAGIAVDSLGNLYVADARNHTIRKGVPTVLPYRFIEVSGNLAFGNVSSGSARTATLTISNIGTDVLTVTDITYPPGFSGAWNGPIPPGDSQNVTVTFAPTAVATYTGNVTVNSNAEDGTNTIAASGVGLPVVVPSPDGYTWTSMPWSFAACRSVAVESGGAVYAVDGSKHTIRQGANHFAGVQNIAGSDNGALATATFMGPLAVASDGTGSLYVLDYASDDRYYAIRKIAGGMVSTLVSGWQAGFSSPRDLACDASGNVYVSDNDNVIRKVTAGGAVSVFAGSSGSPGRTNGIGSAARFYNPSGLAMDATGSFLYVADGSEIRKVEIATANVTTVAGVSCEGLALAGDGSLFVTDVGSYTIKKIGTDGTVTTIGGLRGNLGDADGVGSEARFYIPRDVGVDSAGNVYVAEQGYAKIKKGLPPLVTPTKIIVLSGYLDFGDVPIGASATSTLTISNPGNTALNVSGIAYPAGFSGGGSGTIPAGGAQNVTVTFAPTVAGLHGGTALVNSDATDGTNTIALSGNGVAPRGSLTVSLQPPGIPSVLGFWRVDGGIWQTSDATVSDLSVGTHTVEFDTISGWTTPLGQVVTIANNATTTTSGTYIRQTGALTVVMTPAAAVTAGAQWSLNGGAWNADGATITGLGVGGHVVRFKEVSGWITPADQIVVVTPGATTLASAGYLPPSAATRIIGLAGNLAFGSVAVGTTATATLTINNSGNSPLTVSGISYPTGFSGAWSGSIPAGGSRNVTVTFAPTSATGYGGTVTVNSDATGGSSTIAVSGAGTGGGPVGLTIYDPGFELNAGALIPYSTQTGTSTWLEDFAHGNAAGGLNVLAGMFDDPIPDGAYCAWINNAHSVWQGLPDTLSPGTYTLSVWLGKRKDLGSVGWSPAVIEFDLLAGSTTLTATSFVNNVPDVGRWVQAQKTYTIPADNPNIGQQLVVRFTNPQSGNFNGSFDNVALTFQAAAAPTRLISLTGNLAFGDVAAGTTATATLTIQNSGNSALTVTGIDYPAGFSGAWSGSIAPGVSQNVPVTFTPVVGQAYSGTVTVTSDKTSGANTIAISGTGILPEITVEEPAGTDRSTGAAIDLGRSTVGFPSNAKTIVIKNTGTGPLTITGIDLGGTHPSDFILTKPKLPLTLAPNGSSKLPVTMLPTAKQNRTASLTITSNDADENPFSLGLTGEGTDPHGQYAVGQSISTGLPADITALGEASAISGLPAGLKFDAKTKKLVGRPTAAGSFAAKATVKTNNGNTTTKLMTFVVEALPTWTQGAFTALIWPPDTATTNLDGLGGLLTLNTTPAGACTGSLILGAKKFAFNGQMEGVTEAQRGADPLRSTSTVVTNPKVSAENITLDLEFRAAGDPDAPGLTGKLAYSGRTLDIGPGWQHVWTKTNPAFGNKDRTLNVAIENTQGDAPQGDGFATIKLKKAGTATWAAALADGRKVTGSFTVSPEGEVPLYAGISYPNGGATMALLGTESVGGLLKVGSAATGRWIKRATADPQKADRLYPEGFDVVLDISGAEYIKPATGQLLFGNPSAPLTLTFDLTGGGVDPMSLAAELQPRNKLVIPPDANLPVKIAPTFNATTGLLGGKVSLSDIVDGKKLARTLTFNALYIPDLDDEGASTIRGFFLLPELPDEPGEKPTTTPIQSGQIDLRR